MERVNRKDEHLDFLRDMMHFLKENMLFIIPNLL
jgi:hypothetical protein